MIDTIDRRRRRFQLSFDKLPGPLMVQTLLRGEIYQCYSALGYPTREIPGAALSDQCELETRIFRKSCIVRPNNVGINEIPAGVITTTALFVLNKSGFMENSQEQQLNMINARAYAMSTEGRGEAIIMSTFPKYNRDDLMDMTYEEWTLLVYLATAVQQSLYGVEAAKFVTGEPVTGESATNDLGLTQRDIENAYQILGFRSGEYNQNGSKVVVTPQMTDKGVYKAQETPDNLEAHQKLLAALGIRT